MAKVAMVSTMWLGAGMIVGGMMERMFPTDYPAVAAAGLGIMLMGFLMIVILRNFELRQ